MAAPRRLKNPFESHRWELGTQIPLTLGRNGWSEGLIMLMLSRGLINETKFGIISFGSFLTLRSHQQTPGCV